MSSIKSNGPAFRFLATAALFFACGDSAFAHRGSRIPTEGEPASMAYAFTMTAIVGGMVICLSAVLIYFRWRASHPIPEPDSVSAAVDETPGKPGSEDSSSTWERPADWWKKQ